MVWQVVIGIVALIVAAGAVLLGMVMYGVVQQERRLAGKPPASPLHGTAIVAGNVLALAVLLTVVYVIVWVEPGFLSALLNGTGRYGE